MRIDGSMKRPLFLAALSVAFASASLTSLPASLLAEEAREPASQTSSEKADVAPADAAFVLNGGNYPFHSREQFTTLKNMKKAPERKVASAGTDFEGLLKKNSPDFIDFRTRLFNVKTGDDLNNMLVYLEEKYSNSEEYRKASDEMKLAFIEIRQLLPLRGLVYRMVPLVEKHKAPHSMLLSMVIRTVGQMRIYLPTEQWKAAYEFVTQPYDNVVQFSKISQFQDHVEKSIYVSALNSSIAMSQLATNVSRPIIWDNKLLYKDGTARDELDRYSLVQEAELRALLGAKHYGLGWMKNFVSYNMDQIIPLMKDIGVLHGLDGFRIVGRIEGVASSDVKKVIDNHRKKSPDLFAAKPTAQANFSTALKHMQEMVVQASVAWARVEQSGSKEDPESIINPRFAFGFERRMKHLLPVWEKMVYAQTKLDSRVTGENVNVDLPGFYSHPPKNIADLLPAAHDTSNKDEKRMKTKTVWINKNKATLKYRDYVSGAPTHWSKEAYAHLFPELKKVSGTKGRSPGGEITLVKEVANYQRILTQSHGGALIASPLTVFFQ